MATDEVILSTNMVEPGLRTELCREMSRPFFEATPLAGRPAPLELSIRSQMIDRVMVADSLHGQQQYYRDRRRILKSGLDQYFLRLFRTGTHEGACEDRMMSAGPGDIILFDLARPFEGRVDQGSMLSLLLPRAPIDRATRGRDLHGLILKAGAPMTQFLTDFMVSFSALAAETADTSSQAIEEAATTLIGTCFVQEAPKAHDPALAHVLRHRLLRFIDANLSSPKLGPALLMHRFQVSRAHLYRMFAAEGGVATIIREKRLDAAFHTLSTPQSGSRSITQIADGLGFSSSTQFHRAFRARFSLTPNQARRERLSALANQRLTHCRAFSANTRAISLSGAPWAAHLIHQAI
ncbi:MULTISPECIES: helix-turn-helix domain-containing protein [unclassified Beijerinckia]|uniref:helix-turn-helix domain-containing protein n=1 Tax=unclassified Beijerinckia TaxID=2638183 RepID=UPI0008949509|nr:MULTISPECIES: helix-turn-helix domain-containing protein [unclassified Beijerinckia]MDH7794954.1 AraC-like DNA-binding protein [Beijerinckia sp. GAS462]SEB81782.1 transcriptional regulator, AraC family [Beijerinckia sp. 28-YEA-48]